MQGMNKMMSQVGKNPTSALSSVASSMGRVPCDRGSRVMVYLSVVTLAILILVFSATERFGLSLLWMFLVLVGFVISMVVFL
jgi:hypothetical protein